MTKNELQELRECIYGMDALLDHWFNGDRASLLAAGGEPVYSMADDFRNRALKILENIEKNS